MPKHRPMELLRQLGRQIRARRLDLGLSRADLASAAGISTTQLVVYESAQGHPPCGTLHRIAAALGTSSSALLGETATENVEQLQEMLKITSHPLVGAVVRSMQGMSKEDRQSLKIIASAFASRHRDAESVA